MGREEIWDIYFSKLSESLVREQGRIEALIREKATDEIPERWKNVSREDMEVYIKTAISFIEERLYDYSLDHHDRFLRAVIYGVIDDSLAWYDWRQEKDQIDARIETGLNIMQTPEDIVDDLLDEFGAFPNKSIIESYQKEPKKNYFPDYVLATTVQKVIGERRS